MIESVDNPSVSLVERLKHSAKDRRKEGLFVAEGERFVSDIIKTKPERVLRIFSTDGSSFCGQKAIEVSPRVMKRMSDVETPQGVLALIKIEENKTEDIVHENAFILILEDIRDPGNMGTIFRSLEAAGGSGIVLLGGCTDPYSPKCARATMGSIVRLPFVRFPDTRGLSALKEKGVTILCADLSGKDYDRCDMTGASAVVIGNEANGLSDAVISFADDKICIPMREKTESLNAAVTAAVISFEAARQRRNKRIEYNRIRR